MFCVVLISTLTALSHGKLSSAHGSNITMTGNIVGGHAATIEEYPYQVSFELFNTHICGGTLIRPNVVVTAAHCIKDAALYVITIRAGSTFKEDDGQVVTVKSICTHPNYNAGIHDYDISLFHLDESLQLGDKVRTIPLQPVNEDVLDGTLATVTGWGDLKTGGPGSKNLQVVDLPKMNDDKCKSYYSGHPITDRMHCFGYEEGGKDTCQADSGGPLVVHGKLVGVVSWGYQCALPKKPGIYTKISNPDIFDHISKCIASFH